MLLFVSTKVLNKFRVLASNLVEVDVLDPSFF